MSWSPRRTTQFTAPITSADSPKPLMCRITSTLFGSEQLKPAQFIALAPATAAPKFSGPTSVLM